MSTKENKALTKAILALSKDLKTLTLSDIDENILNKAKVLAEDLDNLFKSRV